MVIAPPLYYYWRTVDDQKEDWELNWTWDDWKSKLFSTDELVLDTNRFEANGMRHPLAGALVYQIGRANGMGVLGSTIMDFANAVLWEYVAEFREKPSVNDIFANTAAGFLIGEPLFQIGNQVDGRSSLFRRGLALIASPFHRAQKEVGLSPLVDEPIVAEPVRGDRRYQCGALRRSSDVKGEVRLGLDLEVLRDPDLACRARTRSGPGSRRGTARRSSCGSVASPTAVTCRAAGSAARRRTSGASRSRSAPMATAARRSSGSARASR